MTVLLRIIARLVWWLDIERGDTVSSAWLSERERVDARTEYHGRSLQWPINKIQNEAGVWNRRKLRRKA